MVAGLLRGLAAQVDSRCQLLLLGSMPGAASLQAARYYAHPRNRFWPLWERLLQLPPQASYARQIAALQAHGLGLWDVIGQCTRIGSLDAAIERSSIVANPLPELIAQLPRLRAIACNGSAAAQAWQRHVQPVLAHGAGLPLLSLPSTSPANAAYSLDRLEQAWRIVLPYLSATAAQ